MRSDNIPKWLDKSVQDAIWPPICSFQYNTRRLLIKYYFVVANSKLKLLKE